MPFQFIKAVRCFSADTSRYETVNLIIENGKLIDITEKELPIEARGEVFDGAGLFVFASLCDIHTHGAAGCDFAAEKSGAIADCMRFYASQGVTSVFPTTVTAKPKEILSAVREITFAAEHSELCRIDGIHIEGPFLSAKRKGAHTEELLAAPDMDFMEQVLAVSKGLKIRVTVAPEAVNALPFIKQCVSLGIQVSLGHTDAGYDLCMRAIEAGADSVTHLYNAMSPLHHREPGAVGTALAEDIYTELICDGKHVHPETVKLTAKVKRSDRMLLVTDSMLGAGMGDTDLTFCGSSVHIRNGEAKMEDGTLAGSTLGLFDAVQNYRKFAGVTLEDACQAANKNPRELMKLSGCAGTVEIGKNADLMLCSEDRLYYTLLGGKIVYRAEQNG